MEEKLQVGSGGAWRIVSHDMRSVDVADAIYPGGRRIDLEYWQNRALASVEDHGAGSDIADYDYIGSRVLKRTMQNGVNLDFENGSGTYYDSLGRPTTWKHVKSGTVKIGFDLTYDRAGNPTAISLLHDTAKGSFSSIGYDSANRLLSSTHAGAWSGQPLAEHWTLDGVGNMKYVDGYTTGSRLTTSFNEYYSVAGVTNTQDDNGNLTSDGTLTFKWDAFNRLSEVKNGGTTVADYTYDAGGRRVAKKVSGTSTYYSMDAWREIAEYTDSNTYPDREFVFGASIDEPLVMDNNDNPDSSCVGTGDNRYYYHQSWQYSVCALTNGSGTIVEGYEYEPYGHHRVFYHSGSAIGFATGDGIIDLGTSNFGNPFFYTGRNFDAESGLQYSRRRYYSEALARYVSRDPLRFKDRMNYYAYAENCPFRGLDTFGLSVSWIRDNAILTYHNKMVPAVLGFDDDGNKTSGDWKPGKEDKYVVAATVGRFEIKSECRCGRFGSYRFCHSEDAHVRSWNETYFLEPYDRLTPIHQYEAERAESQHRGNFNNWSATVGKDAANIAAETVIKAAVKYWTAGGCESAASASIHEKLWPSFWDENEASIKYWDEDPPKRHSFNWPEL